jgi:hypothetical protein
MMINEDPARMMTQKTALRSIRPKDVMTSRFPSRENSTGFWQKKTMSSLHRHHVEFSLEKLMSYRELCI